MRWVEGGKGAGMGLSERVSLSRGCEGDEMG